MRVTINQVKEMKEKGEKSVIRDDDIEGLVENFSVIRNLTEHACGSLVDVIVSNDVNALIVEGIGGRPFMLFKQNSVKIFAGGVGKIKEVLRDFLNGMLQELQGGSCGDHTPGQHH